MSDFAEIFPPGEFLREELEERGWSQLDLAKITGKSERLVNEVVNAKRTVTPETAKALSAAFGTSPQYWLNLENAWQLFQLERPGNDIERRSHLYSKFPVREVIKRGWVEDSENIETLESRFFELYRISGIDEEIKYAANFRGPEENHDSATNVQIAWLYRCWQIAEKVAVPKFNLKLLAGCFTELKNLLANPEDVRHVPRLLGEYGIRFMLVENIKGAKTDGVCFWLDSNSPVVAMSMRYGRLDWFWFTLLHELRHVANLDGLESPMVDVDLINREPVTDVEVKADTEASDFLISQTDVNNFVACVSPLYSTQRVVGFSRKNNIHPALLAGRLQQMKEIPYTQFRSMLVDIRKLLLPGAIADGWGHSISDIGVT